MTPYEQGIEAVAELLDNGIKGGPHEYRKNKAAELVEAFLSVQPTEPSEEMVEAAMRVLFESGRWARRQSKQPMTFEVVEDMLRAAWRVEQKRVST